MSLDLQISSQQSLPKHSKHLKNVKVKTEQTKMLELIDGFYAKAKQKIEKTLTKDNKKTTLLCEEIFRALAHHPRQELYEISRLNDAFFNEITTITNTVTELLKSIESLVVKVGSQLSIIKERSLKKQQRQSQNQKKIVVLRKIQFKKQKKSLAAKLKNIDTINKKVVRFEDNQEENSNACVLDIEGKRVETKLVRSNKVWFNSKNREYLLCTVEKNANEGQLVLFSDKLQTIANFSKVPPINLQTLVNIVQIQDYLYIVNSHSILRINLLNEDDQISELVRHKIILAESNSNQLILWTRDQNSIISVVFMTVELETFHCEKLALSAKTIPHCFKLTQKSGQQAVYFISRSAYVSPELWVIQDQRIRLLSKQIGVIDEIIPLQQSQVVFRRGGQFFKFGGGKLSKRLLQIQTESGQNIQKCCIIGQHLYCLHQSGKYMLECHFRSFQDEENPE